MGNKIGKTRVGTVIFCLGSHEMSCHCFIFVSRDRNIGYNFEKKIESMNNIT